MSKFDVGCEIEAIFPWSKFQDSTRSVADALTRAGLKCIHGSGHTTEYWYWHNETIGCERYEFSMEIASPVIPYENYFDTLQKFFSVFGPNDLRTTRGTGFHHGISFKEHDKNLVLKKRQVMAAWRWTQLHEADELKRWDRNNNEYCTPLSAILARRLPTDISYGYANFANVVVDSGKFLTLNFSRLNCQSPYVEARFPGNANYHKRLDDLQCSLTTVFSLFEEVVESGNVLLPQFIDWTRQRYGVQPKFEKYITEYMGL